LTDDGEGVGVGVGEGVGVGVGEGIRHIEPGSDMQVVNLHKSSKLSLQPPGELFGQQN
jgi:hypothetical protein